VQQPCQLLGMQLSAPCSCNRHAAAAGILCAAAAAAARCRHGCPAGRSGMDPMAGHEACNRGTCLASLQCAQSLRLPWLQSWLALVREAHVHVCFL
jgi:hypothetical protein